MKIQGNNPTEGQELLNKVKDLKKGQEVGKQSEAQKAENEQDKISLSGKAREISELKSMIADLPDVRTDKVAEIKKAVDTGNYNIDALKVAERILEEI
jgi:negative regulator of flagellin synthesis FlgM